MTETPPPPTIHFSASIVAVVALLITLALAAWAWGAERQKRIEAQRSAEEHKLRAAGLLVETRATTADLDSELRAMHAAFVQLRAQLDDVKAKAPDAKVVEVTHVVTKTVVVPGPAGSCLLAPGDSARIEVGEVRLQTQLGNEIITGVASAWKMDSKLFESPFEATTSRAARQAPRQDTLSWGAGPHLQVNHGIGVGFVVGTPIVDVPLGFKLEATGALAYGTNGFSGAINALVRR